MTQRERVAEQTQGMEAQPSVCVCVRVIIQTKKTRCTVDSYNGVPTKPLCVCVLPTHDSLARHPFPEFALPLFLFFSQTHTEVWLGLHSLNLLCLSFSLCVNTRNTHKHISFQHDDEKRTLCCSRQGLPHRHALDQSNQSIWSKKTQVSLLLRFELVTH